MTKVYAESARTELVAAVKRGETVARVARRLGVTLSTAYSWVQRAGDGAAAPPPTFIELVTPKVAEACLVVRVGVAEIEVHAGFDPELLRAIVAALGGAA